MRHQEQDPFGSTDVTTEYEREGKPGGKSGSSKTKMAVGLTAVTLTLFLSWLLITPFDSDPLQRGRLRPPFQEQKGRERNLSPRSSASVPSPETGSAATMCASND